MLRYLDSLYHVSHRLSTVSVEAETRPDKARPKTLATAGLISAGEAGSKI